jgi:predicted TIM-barrel fold metal-dependent hydrolase
MLAGDRYVVISSDCHAGASVDGYREYLDAEYVDEFGPWKESFVNPFGDLVDTESRDYLRNYDFAIRQHDLEADGIVGEVVFPNTIPPFFNGSPLVLLPEVTSARELELRWAGLRAHNRWLADFCAELPGRRAGVGQILLEDVDRAVEELHWIADAGLFGGVLLPNPSAGSRVAPIHAPMYEPIWDTCAELGLVVNTHSGSGGPDLGPYPASPMVMYVEFTWFGHRPLVRMLVSGVMERHPNLKFVFTETGNAWVPATLDELEWYYSKAVDAKADTPEAYFGEFARENLPHRPWEYWDRQCFLGASILSRSHCAARALTGVEKIMWGSDYPHTEGTNPYTRESMRHTFGGVPSGEVAAMLGGNAAAVYGFDLDRLRAIADAIGPTVAELDAGLPDDQIPADAVTVAFDLVSP